MLPRVRAISSSPDVALSLSVGREIGGEEDESAVRAKRLSASLVRRSSLSDTVVFSRRSLSVGPLKLVSSAM